MELHVHLHLNASKQDQNTQHCCRNVQSSSHVHDSHWLPHAAIQGTELQMSLARSIYYLLTLGPGL